VSFHEDSNELLDSITCVELIDWLTNSFAFQKGPCLVELISLDIVMYTYFSIVWAASVFIKFIIINLR